MPLHAPTTTRAQQEPTIGCACGSGPRSQLHSEGFTEHRAPCVLALQLPFFTVLADGANEFEIGKSDSPVLRRKSADSLPSEVRLGGRLLVMASGHKVAEAVGRQRKAILGFPELARSYSLQNHDVVYLNNTESASCLFLLDIRF